MKIKKNKNIKKRNYYKQKNKKAKKKVKRNKKIRLFLENFITKYKTRIVNRHPTRLVFKMTNFCYVCETNNVDIYTIPIYSLDLLSGWLCCKKCSLIVLNVYRPQYCILRRIICEDSLINICKGHLDVSFTRRSRTTNLYPYVENAKLKSLHLSSSTNRFNASISWHFDIYTYEKHVYLSNIIRTDPKFPQTVKEFLTKLALGNTILSEEMYEAIIKEIFNGESLESFRVQT